MKATGIFPLVIVLLLFAWSNQSLSQSYEIQWWGDLGGAVPTSETSRTEQATYEAYLAIFSGQAPDPNCGGSPYKCWFGLIAPMCLEWMTTQAGSWAMRNTNIYGCSQYTHTGGWDVICVSPPSCMISPSSLDFGVVFVNSSVEMSFTITNTGGGILSGSVSESSAHYDIISGGGAYNLGASESKVVTVRFAPISDGFHDCTVETGDALCIDVTCAGVGQYTSFVKCVADSTIPAFSTVPFLELNQFGVKNASGSSRSFNYYLEDTGPATLVDNGNPLSLSGETPILEPGMLYYPPRAALEIPAIREYQEEHVTLNVEATDDATLAESCVTVIAFEPPVPTCVQRFEAVAGEGWVELTWEVDAEEESIKGYRIYRKTTGEGYRHALQKDLIPSKIKEYNDTDVLGAKEYGYVLGVVFSAGNEMLSQEIKIQTKEYNLVLHQNHPNPFNPSTTIAFTLPETAHINLSIYNLEGKIVTTLLNGIVEEGFNNVTWDGTDSKGIPVSSGIYFYRLKAGSKTLTKKMVLLK